MLTNHENALYICPYLPPFGQRATNSPTGLVLMNDAEFDIAMINRTLMLARASIQAGEFPFAALICENGKIVSEKMDKRLELHDPTAHPEMIAIQEFCRTARRLRLSSCTLYSNVEPCVMCASAAYWAYIPRIVFSVTQKQLQALTGGPDRLDSAQVFNRTSRNAQIIGPLLESEGLEILRLHSAFAHPHSIDLHSLERK
jgi:tRNA(Arg) A34 adenosine deaminase TadA